MVLALWLAIVLAPAAMAQGCAMCSQSAAASGAQGREALRHGILILLIPTLSLFIGFLVFLYRRRDSSRVERDAAVESTPR